MISRSSHATLKSYYMVDPSTHLTVSAPSFKHKLKVLVSLDKYVQYARNLAHVETPRHLIALRSKDSAVLLRQKVDNGTIVVELDGCDYFNLFKTCEVSGKKARLAVLDSPPPTATSAKISLVRAGKLAGLNFTEHLKFYFSSPKILRPGHLFCMKIPVTTPANVPVSVWLKHTSSNTNFTQPTFPVHFKVVSASRGQEELTDFFYISSESTSLYEVANCHEEIPSFVPNRRVDLFYSAEITALKNQLEMANFIPTVITGGKGSCISKLVENLAGHLGVGLYEVPGIDYAGEAVGALENKYSALLSSIALSLPCLVHLDCLELLGQTRDGGSVDPRVVRAVHGLVEGVRGLRTDGRVFLIGSCMDTTKVPIEIRYLFDNCVVLPSPNVERLYSFLSNNVKLEQNTDLEKKIKKKLSKMSLEKTIDLINLLHQELGFGLNHHETISAEQCSQVLTELRIAAEESSSNTGIPDTRWEDIGGIDHVRREVEETIEIPLKYGEMFGAGVRRSGLLLHGRPGCGKTMVARAIASQCNLSFISIQGPELLNSFVGQSEDNVRKIFENARRVAPTVLFFDEIDAIAPRRSGGVLDRVLAQLLSEMDGVESSTNVFIIGATNRPELLDPALLRPGRLDKLVEVSVGEDVDSRIQVLHALSRKLNLAEDVNLRTLAEMSGSVSGAECYGLVLEACYHAIQRCVQSGEKCLVVKNNDLITAIHGTRNG